MQKRIPFALFSMILAAGMARAGCAQLLSSQPSAFLRSFASSPVDWLPWGEAAFARARQEQKPVFLFVGSFTNELAGAMRRQSFANPKSAEWLNKYFVCVIVDRDERPDVAALYQAYISDVKQLGGWPLNVWLTPEFLPFEGASYLSPSEDWGAPGFLKLANQAESAWVADPAACRRRAAEAKAQIVADTGPAPKAWDAAKAKAQLVAADAAWKAVYDAEHGGFGDAPRNPEPELIRFLLTQAAGDRGEALASLRSLARSAVRDPLDGGFFRYANDASGRIPYPQKTLSDQARIALAFLAGAQGPDAPEFGVCTRGALDYALARLARPDGTFSASVDATADDYAAYYSWTAAEIDAVLGPDAAAFKAAHGVEAHGNVPQDDDPSGTYAGRNFLRDGARAAAPGPAEQRLLAARERRPAPLRDDRASAGAHGLLIDALARAGSQLGEPRYLDAARRIAHAVEDAFILKDGSVRRFAGSNLPAAPEDYAALALGFHDLAKATGDRRAGSQGGALLRRLDSLFYDPAGGRYFACDATGAAALFARPHAAGESPSAECLAVVARAEHAPAIASALSLSLQEASAQAPGDQLLALGAYAANPAP